ADSWRSLLLAVIRRSLSGSSWAICGTQSTQYRSIHESRRDTMNVIRSEGEKISFPSRLNIQTTRALRTRRNFQNWHHHHHYHHYHHHHHSSPTLALLPILQN